MNHCFIRKYNKIDLVMSGFIGSLLECGSLLMSLGICLVTVMYFEVSVIGHEQYGSDTYLTALNAYHFPQSLSVLNESSNAWLKENALGKGKYWTKFMPLGIENVKVKEENLLPIKVYYSKLESPVLDILVALSQRKSQNSTTSSSPYRFLCLKETLHIVMHVFFSGITFSLQSHRNAQIY